ncbi:hypothetical protein EJ08DRAFT_642037 [Tothia fuscella]|uniref:CCZ1/INTU/HSP4 first Longin domain-containing protein n=1 Tax=Tothia fuscella TaxID=1048955 RepID=A0A9P4TTJ1_9PEZI|nr:hypothetical protein EJ08DRAFT_642037 [Tothia fuscella]
MSEPKVIPAQLSFLAIYNPSLGTTDETFEDQIVFWYTKGAGVKKKAGKDAEKQKQLQEEENEKLRQIGLAQGMVDFAKGFSNGTPVDSVETEKSRIVMHELESGWWILASIDLTRLPIAAAPSTNKPPASGASNPPSIEYSSREVSPAPLLLQQLIRAHGIFLLHNGSALDNLFQKLERSKFCNLLERFWSRFAQNWDVLLHGNPAVDIYGGLKLAAGGELGIGVGEEEWGSGEREVLEDFAARTEGLVDLVVSRFGEPSESQLAHSKKDGSGKVERPSHEETLYPWMGATHNAEAVDGIFFSGVGAITRSSLRDISHWTEWIYAYGDHAYGVKDNPTRNNTPPGIPPPIVSAVERSLERATSSHDIRKATFPKQQKSSGEDTGAWTKYLTLGYGSSWGRSDFDHEAEFQSRLKEQIQLEEDGHFVIGLKGDLEDDEEDLSDPAEMEAAGERNQRILLRTLYVELKKKESFEEGDASSNLPTPFSPHSNERHISRLRVVVYVHRPFIYTFLFHPQTDALQLPGFYKNMHTFFAPLHKPLSSSTSPARVAERINAASTPYTTSPPPQQAQGMAEQPDQPIFDIVYDPRSLSVHASIPNITIPGTQAAEGFGNVPIGWSRAEALNVHSAILEIWRETRGIEGGMRELERSVKTARGWWVVWMRLDDESASNPQKHAQKSEDGKDDSLSETTIRSSSKATERGIDYFNQSSQVSQTIIDDGREAILVRRARDAIPPSKSKVRAASGLWGFGGASSSGSGNGGGKDTGSGWGPARLAEGVGVDARKYVEGLLSLNR